MSGRNPPSYCTLTLIAMHGHQQKGRQNNTSSNNKDKSNTIIVTSIAEDHDDENLHNPETVQDAVIHLEVDEVVVSHIQRIGCQPEKKLLYTVANPARGLLNRGKKKKKVWQRPPPPARCSFGEKIKIKNKSCDASTCLGATQVGVTQVVSVRFASVQGFLRLVS